MHRRHLPRARRCGEACLLFGREPGWAPDFAGYQALIHPDDREHTLRQIERALVGETDATSRGAGQRILSVEDEQPIRELATRILQEAGYDVLMAADGDEALELARASQGAIDALVTDVVLPRVRAPTSRQSQAG